MSNKLVVSNEEEGMRLIDQALSGLLGERPKSADYYRSDAKEFLAFALQNRGSMIHLVLAQYMSHLEDRGLAPATIARKRIVVRRFLRWWMMVGLISREQYELVREIEGPKVQGQRARHWLTKEQMQTVIDAIDTSTLAGRRDKAILMVLFDGCLRRGELAKLTWGHLTKVKGYWVIQNMERKHGRMQDYIVLHPSSVEAIFAYSPAGYSFEHIFKSIQRNGVERAAITAKAINDIVIERTEACGMRITAHDVRRTGAKHMEEQKIPLRQLQVKLGHQSMDTTARYLEDTVDFEAFAELEGLEV